MSDGTKIEWTDATWNPITGCSMVSAGCTNCYAMTLAFGRMQNHPSRAGLDDGPPLPAHIIRERRDAEIRRLRAGGMTLRDIAHRIGMSHEGVRAALRRAGWS